MRAFQKANASILYLALLLCTSASVAIGVQVPYQSQIENLKSDDVYVRRRAAAVLAQASTIPSEAIPVLLQSIGDEDRVVGVQSAVALIKSGALPEVDGALQSPDGEVRHHTLPLTRISILVDNGRAFCDTLGHGQLDNGMRAHFYAPIDPASERNVG